LAGSSCSGQVRLRVAAAPEIAPAVRDVADRWIRGGVAVEGLCAAVDVEAVDPVDVAATVAQRHGVSLAGVGEAPATAVPPDVWVPDSSTWLLRLQSNATGFTPANRASIARSPVVVAVPEPVAGRMGWPGRRFTWTELLDRMTTGPGFNAGIVEPGRDAAALSGLMSLSAAAGAAGADARQRTVAALRALAAGRSLLPQDLLARFPQSQEPAAVATALTAATLSEEDVVRFNAKQPAVALAALYPDPAPASLDYPYAVMPGIEPARSELADRLFKLLSAPKFGDRLGALGLRAADGTVTAGLAVPRGAPSPAGSPPVVTSPQPGGTAATAGPVVSAVDRALSAWSVTTQVGRMLAVIDVSPSMRQPVPTAGGMTREQVTVAAASRGLGLFDDQWAIGLWTFAGGLDGPRDWREVQPVGPLATQRSRLEASLRTVAPGQGTDGGLAGAVLAAYEKVRDGWQPGRVNSIVLFTDGSEDAGGVERQRLVAGLKKLADPDRPIQLIVVGIGRELDRAPLDAMVKVTGGGVFVTEDPARIGDIFLRAIALRPAATR
jgi:hypothetical protein